MMMIEDSIYIIIVRVIIIIVRARTLYNGLLLIIASLIKPLGISSSFCSYCKRSNVTFDLLTFFNPFCWLFSFNFHVSALKSKRKSRVFGKISLIMQNKWKNVWWSWRNSVPL